MQDLSFDLFDPDQTQHMWGLAKELRARCPAFRVAPGLVYLARYEDNAEVFKRAKLYSSREGFRASGVVVPDDESFLGEIDPPLHTTLRKLLHSAFTPRAAAQSELFTRQVIDEAFDELIAAGSGDLMGLHDQTGLCARLPVAVSAAALGFPRETHDDIARMTQELLHSNWTTLNETEHGTGIGGGFPEFSALLDAHVAERVRTGPVGDLLDDLLALRLDGEPLSTTHLRTLLVNILSGGLSTTSLLGNLLYHFVSEPELEAALRADPSIIPEAVEECLRLEPPVLYLFRTVTTESRFADEVVAPGERVVLGIASGNRDERVYQDAEEFRLDRGHVEGTCERHLSFGLGAHLCLGIHYARMQGQVLMQATIDRFAPGDLALADDFVREFIPAAIEYGPERLDVVLRSRQGGARTTRDRVERRLTRELATTTGGVQES